jgi:hypothetical protein
LEDLLPALPGLLEPLGPLEPSASRRARLAVAAVHAFWRNTVAEEWHAQAWGLSDGEMLRANVAATRSAMDGLDTGCSWIEIADSLTRDSRPLPDGRTLLEYAGPLLEDLQVEAGAKAETLQEVEARHSRATAENLLLVQGLWYGSRWWGLPEWPARVERFLELLNAPADRHWKVEALSALPPRPADIAHDDQLRRLLLAGPDQLSAEAATWCVRAGLGHVLLPGEGTADGLTG